MAWWPVDTQVWCPWNVTASSYVSVRPNSADVTETDVTVAQYPQTIGEAAPSYGVYTKGVERYTMALDALAFDPKPRDRLTYGGNTLTVLDVTKAPVMSFWVLTTVNLALAADLRQTGALKRPVAGKDDAGRPALASYSTVTSGIQCRLQHETESAEDVFERRTGVKRYTCYVGQQLTVKGKDVFEVGGQRYTILEYKDAELLDRLPSLNLELIP